MLSAFLDVAPKVFTLVLFGGLLWGCVAWDERRIKRRSTKRAFAGNKSPLGETELRPSGCAPVRAAGKASTARSSVLT